jgi:hypothetical protein
VHEDKSEFSQRPLTFKTPGRVQKLFCAVPSIPIFHYTSQQGFLGILKTKTLWASKIPYLNDSLEFKYALDLVEKRITFEGEKPRCRASKPFCDAVKKWLKGSIQYPNLFVASFSERGDLLSQWRAYCPDGIGFSIGFTYNQLRSAIQSSGAALLKCEYGLDEQTQTIDDLIAASLDQVDEKQFEESAQTIAGLFMFYATGIAPAFKDAAFQEEREWRIVIGPTVSTLEVSFRPGKSMIIPYWEFPLCENDESFEVEKIYVGPNPHGLLSGWSAIDATARHNAHSRQGVQQSSIPYRSW